MGKYFQGLQVNPCEGWQKMPPVIQLEAPAQESGKPWPQGNWLQSRPGNPQPNPWKILDFSRSIPWERIKANGPENRLMKPAPHFNARYHCNFSVLWGENIMFYPVKITALSPFKPPKASKPQAGPEPPPSEVAHRRHQYPPLSVYEPSQKRHPVEGYPETNRLNPPRAFAMVSL